MTAQREGGSEREFTYGYDVHGSISLLLEDEGNARGAYGYDAYGKADAEHLSAERDVDSPTEKPLDGDPTNPYGYGDKRTDFGSGTLDMGARHFSPDTGRFLQDDMYEDALSDLGLSEDPLTRNRYALAGGNPVSYVETDGHEPAASYTDQRAANFYYSRTPARTGTASKTPDATDRNSRAIHQRRIDTSWRNGSARSVHKRVAQERARDRNLGDHVANGVGGHLKGFLGTDLGLGRPDSNTYKQRHGYWDNPGMQAFALFAGGGKKKILDDVADPVSGGAKHADEAADATKAVSRGTDLDPKALSRPDLIGRRGRGPDVRLLEGDAADTYARLARGARDAPHPKYAGPRVTLDDGTVIGLRQSRRWGPTIDVNPANGPAYRIHFE